VPVDAAGHFCVKLALAAERYVAHVEVTASGLIDGSRLDSPLDLRLPAVAIVALAFDPERPALSLDEPTTDLEVVASVEEEGVTRGAPGLHITVSNESGDALGDATTLASGRAQLRVASARLGKLGRGELRATFAGGASAGPSACSLAVERQSRIVLSAPDADRADGAPRLPVGSPEEGIPLRVVAAAQCASAGCLGSPTGAVEARVGEAIVGAATLEHGQARLLVSFARPAASEVPLRIRYLPDAPWFLAGDELELTQPLRSPSPWRRLPLGIAGLGVLAWLAIARLSALKAPQRPGGRPGKMTGRPVVARVELLQALPEQQGWTGVVVDAHDDTPVDDARVAIERRGFERIAVVTETRSGKDGRFALSPVAHEPGDEIASEGALHAPLRGALPPSGDLRVALVLRRRAVLDRMVAWARRRGKPFDARPEPTPGHVRRAAGGDSPVGRWADAVERAAFGGETVDARAQAELEKLAPAAVEPADPAGHPRAR
jgi:CBS domain-containing protein